MIEPSTTNELNASVIGGGIASGKGATASVDTAVVNITGGTFEGNIHAGGAAVNGGTATVENTVLNIIDGKDAISSLPVAYAGGLDSGVSGTLAMNIKGVDIDSPNKKISLYGGSKAASANTILHDGKVEMRVSDSTICADLRGGGGAFGDGAAVYTEESLVHVANTAVNGYEQGSNTWTGRIFGAGVAEGLNTSITHGSSTVIVENVSGVAYDLNTDTVSSNPGTRVYGGGQAYASNTTKAHPQVTVGSTQVVIKGQETALDAVLGGSIVSGTSDPDNCGLVVTGQTDVRIEAGTISTYVVGGNNSNWFGRSVIGNQNDSGDYEFNGVHYDAGSTHVSITGGDLSSATVMGGSLSDYAGHYKENGVRESVVFGSTDVSISGGKIGTVVGGGLARYYNEQAASGVTDGKPSSTVQGRTHVQISGGETGDVIGGGLAVSNQSDLGAIATVTGESLVEVSGGIITGDVIGGGLAQGEADATLDGTANIVISNGAIKGNVYAGGYADGDGLGSACAAVDQANMTISGGTIEGSVYAGGAALNGGTADVEDFDVRITGGTIKGNVVAGNDTGETPETKAVVLKTSPSKGTAGKGGTITIGGDATIGGKVDASAGGVATNVVIDGADATVTGGYEGNKDSTLTFNNYDDKFDNVAYGFGTLNVAEGSNVRMDAVVSGKQGTAPEDPQTGFFGARHDAEGSSNPITITGGGTITAKQFHVSTNADVTIAHGNVVADDVQVQSATLKVGGESTSASLTVNEELIIDKTHPGNQNIDVENLGTLTLGKNIVLDENGELKAEYLDTVPSHVKAGGTLKINGLDGKTLTDKELASLQGLLNSNIPDIPPGEGLLDLGGADLGEVEPNADGTVSYANVAGITTDSLKDTTVTVTDEQNAAGISGGFQAVKLTGADTELNAKGTLVLAGSQNGDNLVIDTKGAVADLRVGGAYATRDTSAVTLGLADANNSGTVGTVTLNAGTDNKATLNVIGAGAAEFKVGDIRANESTNTINVAGATLKTGNITTESGTKALDKLNITSGIVNASGNVNITDVALANGVLTANKVPATAEGVPATGDITLGTLSGQGAVVADNALTVTNDYNGADTDALGLQADTLTTAAFNSTKGDVAIKASQWNASGTTTLKGDTVVLTEAGTFTGAFTMDGGTLVAQSGDDANLATLTFKDDATFTNGAVTVVDSIKMNGTTNKTLTVGTDDDKVGGTTLSAQHIDLNDGMLLVDPAWNKASSNVAVASMGTPTPSSTTDVVLDGSVGVGQNSYLALGTADTGWLPGVVGNYTKGVGLSQDGITAALGVFKGIEIADGKGLVVDGGLTGTASGEPLHDAVSAATNTAEFAKNSLLVVNGANIYGDKAAIKFAAASGGTLTVDKTSKLLVTDAVAGQDYTIVDNVTTVQDGTSTAIAPDETVWKTEGLSTTTDMISLGDAKFDGTNKVTTSAVRNDAHTVFPNLSDGMANAVNDLYTGHDGAAGEPRWDYADVNSADMGVRFLSRATDNRFLGADKDAAAATIESAARIAFAGAVPQMTKMASDAGSNAVVNRLGFANPADGAQAMNAEGQIVDRNTTGFALWIAPLWQSQHGWGMEADNLDYGFNGNLGGVSLGADYTFENAIRAGITFNIGGGYAESSGGDLNSTENRMSFWGLGAYAGWNYENFGLMADVSYTSTWNDLKQDMDSRMGMGDLEADVQASAISAGLRAEYKLETSVLDVIPHIGVRYMSLNTWGFDAESNGGTVLEGDGFHQDIWTFPVGVTFTKDFTLDSGWSFKPSVDFSVIPAAGDIKAKQDVAFTGLPGSYEVETQMMDYLTWQGGVGLEMGNDTMSFGVNYTLQAGQHTTGHGVFGSFRYEF